MVALSQKHDGSEVEVLTSVDGRLSAYSTPFSFFFVSGPQAVV